MIDFNDLDKVLTGLKKSQDADSDIREYVREANHFIDKRDGQWEPEIVTKFKDAGKPRYTFDKTNPIVDQIAGEMENADFTLRVRPAGGEASMDTAKTIDGLIRNIRNISNAEDVFNAAGRSMITGGMDGWEVVQDWVDGDSFDQDLFIRKIHNWVDRVWFDPGSEEQDHSDADWVIVLQTILPGTFEKEFPDKSLLSVGDDKPSDVYTQKPAFVVIGRILYKKPENIEIIRMTNGAVYKMDAFENVKDELAAQGITPELDADGEPKTRKRKSHRVHSRLFSGDDWLNDEQETVFNQLPVCATYGNFKISENKRIVRGIVEKLMDQQRVINYGESEQVRQTALAPVSKIVMTNQQATGNNGLSTLNVDNTPLLTYKHTDGQPPPYRMEAPQPNMALQVIIQRASEGLNVSAGMFQANMGDNPGLQSGVAIDRQISKGDNATTKWFSAQKVAICYTGKVIIDGALQRVYDATRQARQVNEDGSSEMVPLNKAGADAQGQPIIINDLSVGEYDVVCEIGLAFASKQREAVAAFTEMAAVDPSLMEVGRDIWLSNQDAPGMPALAERVRHFMVMNGQVPEDQLTDDEKQLVAQQQAAAQQQPQQPDPLMVAAQAEQTKAQAAQTNANNDQMRLQIDAEKVRQSGIELELKAQQAENKALLDASDSNVKATNIQADTLNKLIKSVNDGVPLSPELMAVINQQVIEVAEEQAVQ